MKNFKLTKIKLLIIILIAFSGCTNFLDDKKTNNNKGTTKTIDQSTTKDKNVINKNIDKMSDMIVVDPNMIVNYYGNAVINPNYDEFVTVASKGAIMMEALAYDNVDKSKKPESYQFDLLQSIKNKDISKINELVVAIQNTFDIRPIGEDREKYIINYFNAAKFLEEKYGADNPDLKKIEKLVIGQISKAVRGQYNQYILADFRDAIRYLRGEGYTYEMVMPDGLF